VTRRLNLALALTAALFAVPAHAGAVLDGSNDRIDVGTCGDMGSSLKASSGWTFTGWLKTTQTSVCALLATFSDGADGADQTSLWMFGNAGYTSDYVNSDGRVMLSVDGTDDTGFVWYQNISSPDWNDGNLHHHALAVLQNGAIGSYSIIWYVDGQAFNSWTKPWNAATTTITDWTNTKSLGAGAKSPGNVWFDHCAGTFIDWRMYKKQLTAVEVNELYRNPGTDALTANLYRRWPLQDSSCNETVAGTACTAQNGPTWSTAYELNGQRSRR
jgi:hypothetical protein